MKRNPKVPDFTNHQAMLSSTLDETGGVVTSKFDEMDDDKSGSVSFDEVVAFVSKDGGVSEAFGHLKERLR